MKGSKEGGGRGQQLPSCWATNYHSMNQYEFQTGNNVEASFKWIFVLGRFLGISPISVSFKPGAGSIRFRWISLATAHSISLNLVALAVFGAQAWKYFLNLGTYQTVLEEMEHTAGTLYTFSVLYTYLHWLLRAPALLNLFHMRSDAMKKSNLPETKDNSFSKFSLKISLLVMITCLVESSCYDTYHVKYAANATNVSLTEAIYNYQLGPLSAHLPHYSIPTSAILIYAAGIGVYCWNFADIFIIMLCHALSTKFGEIDRDIISLSDSHISRVKTDNEEDQDPFKPKPFWKDFRRKIISLSELTKEVNKFVAPLLLACYGFSIYLVLLNTLRFLSKSNPTGAGYRYVYASLFKFTLRVVLLTHYAGQVYHSTERLLRSLESFPGDDNYDGTARRLERMLARRTIGIRIFGTVLITHRTYISILLFVFTTVIILLQAMATVVSGGESRQKI